MMTDRFGRVVAAVVGLCVALMGLAVPPGPASAAMTPGAGAVWAWGNNWYGQLGGGTTDEWATAPVGVGIEDATAVAAGLTAGYALRADGTVWAWGDNERGQLGDGTTTPSSAPVQVSGLAGVTAIASEGRTAYALRDDGTVWAWGSNYGYELGIDPRPSYWSTVPLQVPGLAGVVAIAASSGSIVAVRSDGTVWGWGVNGGSLAGACPGNCVRPTQIPGLSDVMDVALDSYGGYALLSDGTVLAWGSNSSGRLGNGTTVASPTPVQVSGLSEVAAIAAGQYNGYALRSDGTLWAWGKAINLGNGTTLDSSLPVRVEGLADVRAVAGAVEVVSALLADGTVWVWGNGTAGQFGNGLSPASYVPAKVSGLPSAGAIAAGYLSQYALAGVPDDIPHAPLSLVALEVTQSVQDLDNTVPLVQGRPTLVRAYLGSTDGETTLVAAGLRGFANGVELESSPLTPTNPAGGALIDLDALGDRAFPERTLNFELPHSWTFETEIEFLLEYPDGLVCLDQWTGNPLCSETVSFTDPMPLDVNYVSVGWEENDTRVERTLEDLEELAMRVRSQLPVGHEYQEGFQYGYLRFAERPTNLSRVNERLASARRVAGAPAEQRWYGVLPGFSGTTQGGRAAGRVASGWDGDLNEERAFGHARNRVVHELGHTLGLDHSVNAEENGYGTFLGIPINKRGWCKEDAALFAPDFPHWRVGGGEDPVVAALGPMGSVRGQIWGTDLRFFGSYTPLALSDPAGTTSLMSYCEAEDATSQWRWISARDYQRLLTEDLSPISGSFFDAPGSGALVRGVIAADGTVAFTPVLPIDAAPTADDPAGTHEIALLDAAGFALHTVRFTPLESHGDVEEGGADEPGDWIVGVVVPPGLGGAASMELRQDGEVLAATQVSAATPVATIAAPTTGTTEDVTFTWSAADADGDPLTHTLLYSADDGQNWTVVAIDLTDQSVSIPRWALPGTGAVQVRVISSDGANTTTATSESFSMPDLPPSITIVSPADGTEVAGAQMVGFSAEASDPEDGSAVASGVVWESDLDGHLGSGATFQIRADQLSEGTHHITATVVDSAGQASSATVVVTVKRVAEPPVEDPPTCAVRYTVHGSWRTGFISQIWIRNIGTEPIDGWTLEWEMPAGQSVAHHFGSTMTRDGTTVTATNRSWNAAILPGRRITIGFIGVKPAGEAAAVPTWFRVNGAACE